jgi:hypothetical protein
VGDRLDFIPEAIVRGAFLSLWVRENRQGLAQLKSAIGMHLSEEWRASDSKWFYTLDNKNQLGPVLLSELQKSLKSGQVTGETRVHQMGTKHWITLEEALATQ